jgi:hypothetical protein
MNEKEWKTFLVEYNSELLSYQEVLDALPSELISTGWLGYKGATGEAIKKTEKRLGTRLPLSFREFLKASNGWHYASVSIFDLRPASKVAWFSEQNQDWIDAYVGSSSELPAIPDKEYFIYGRTQDCVKFRTEYLQTALQVSDVRDSAVVLLNPKIVTAEGEWETWFFANWLPGAQRYRSFAEWLVAERQNCRKQFQRLPKAKVQKHLTVKKPVSVKKAQAAARAGEIELAVESLENCALKGDDSAAASLAELYAFLGQWDKVIANAGRLIANPGAVYAGNVFNDMIQLLGRAGHVSKDWARVVEVVEAASKANARRCAEQFRNEKDKVGRDIIRNAEERDEKLFRNLIQYAARQGKPPHELLAIFGVSHWTDERNEQERNTWYENAVNNVDSVRPDLKKNPQAKMEHFFSLAKGVLEDEALRLYEAHGKTFAMEWQAAEYVAPIYVQRDERQAAWSVIEANVKHWWPVDHSQVAPLVLLTNEHLHELMTPDRCHFVLRTPRGPEGVKVKPKNG